MYHTIKTLLAQGKSLREISRELGMCRKTVTRIQRSLASGMTGPAEQVRAKTLDDYQDDIREYHGSGLTAVLIHQKLVGKHGLEVSYPSVARCIERLKKQEVYVPIQSKPGEESQVDFGYLGTFRRHGHRIKVWVFSMVLSHSRHAYYQLVTNQRVSEFLDCHVKAFEFFGGVPRTVKLDNLKSGVTTPDRYEPLMQEQYAAFLAYYGSAGIACPPHRPQAKGKVESSIKYVKQNFLKGFEGESYDDLVVALRCWNAEFCNKRVHGTTRKVPEKVFKEVEQQALLALPARRYQILEVSGRKVSRLAHISYRHNYYSVPAHYAGMTVRLESDGTLLKIYHQQAQIALHAIHQDIGHYVSLEEHRPLGKRSVSRQEYQARMAEIGPNAAQFCQELMTKVPSHWIAMTRGILSLRKKFNAQVIDDSCERALRYKALSYQQVKKICETGLYQQKEHTVKPLVYSQEYGHELSMYDRITHIN